MPTLPSPSEPAWERCPLRSLLHGRKMLPAIPQELSDMILDFLFKDVTALRSAGLVCKSWLPASRFHLFSNILFVPDRGFEVICAEYSTIPPHIRHLSIAGDQSQFVDETLLRLPLLSNLKSLALMQINMANLTPDAKKRLTTLLQNITTLYLSGFHFETVDQAVDFIASAPRLEHIVLISIGCSESRDYSSQAIAPPLRRINLRSEPNPLVDNIMDWFCRCHPTSSVHTLDIIRHTTVDNILTVCKFIRHLGSVLENLTISCFDSDQTGQVQIASERIDLSQNIFLRNILFSLHADLPRPPPCGWIISILSSITHPSLEAVTISIHLDHIEVIDALELSALDTLFLNQPLANNSTKLCFNISGNVDRNAVLAVLKDGLPKLDGKKRLVFV